MKYFIMAGVVAGFCALPVVAQDAPSTNDLNSALKINPASAAALAELESRAAEGDGRAALFASGAYRGGIGSERDLDKALALAARAAELGNVAGIMAQGDLTLQIGGRSPQATAAARVFWDKAADMGNSGALIRLSQVDAPALVERIQDALVTKGYEVGPVDGIVGPQTLSALSAFCASADIADACAGKEISEPSLLRVLGRSGLFDKS